jgi:hypothetical protein
MKVEEIVFKKHYDGLTHIISMADIPKEFLSQEFYIDIDKTPAFYGSEHGNEDYTILRVIKVRDQTEEEKQKMRLKFKEIAEETKRQRYQEYLKLKKEFEP